MKAQRKRDWPPPKSESDFNIKLWSPNKFHTMNTFDKELALVVEQLRKHRTRFKFRVEFYLEKKGVRK